MLIPIRSDNRLRKTPWVNYALIGANVLIYLALDVLGRENPAAAQIKSRYMLYGQAPELGQFITYQFLHGDAMHLLGNMLFLWLFGSHVSDKMGAVPYLLFYLACGVFAGLGFAWTNPSAPVLGASGSIAGITTAYLVLFPRSNITVLYWWFFVGTFELSAMILIALKLILWDNIIAMQFQSEGYVSVAYEAHLAGYAFGFATTLGLLLIRALPRDQFDILALLDRWNRRRALADGLADPTARVRATYGRVARPVRMTERDARPVEDPAIEKTTALRSRISEFLRRGDLSSAATTYRELLGVDSRQVLPRPQQLDVANQLMSEQRHADAADAYERYLAHYPSGPDVDQVHLLLGLIYAKYLANTDRARHHLSIAAEKLTSPEQQATARQLLETLGSSR